MKDILEIITLDGFLTVEKLEEFLHELRCYVNLQRSNFDALIDHQLQEELIDTLQVGPCGIHILFGLDTCLRES
jgi:hypothetical protein